MSVPDHVHVTECHRLAVFCFTASRRWNTDLNRLEEDNRKQLADVLSDPGRPWCSVYGAVVGLLAFGLQVRQNLSRFFMSYNSKHSVAAS